MAAFEAAFLGPRLEQVGADPEGAFAQFLTGRRHRAAGHHHHARAPGAGGIGGHRGIAVDQAGPRHRNAQNLVGDLGESRLQTLTVGMGADPQFEAAIRGQAGAGLLVAGHHRNAPAGIDRGAVRRLLAVDREAEADPAPIRLALTLAGANRLHIDGFQRAGQGLRVVAAVEVLLRDVLERHLLGPHEIPLTDGLGGDPRRAGDGVEDEFQGEAHAGAGDAAIGQDRALVGRHRPRPAAIGREIVGTGQDAGDLRRLQAGREGIGRVGAGIDGGLAVDAAQGPVPLRVGGDAVMVLAAIGVGGQVLAPVLQPADRVAAAQCEPREGHVLGEQDRLVAEAAADIRRDDADAPLLDPEAFGKAVAHDMRHLAGGVDHELVEAVIEIHHGAAALDRRHALTTRRDGARHLDRRVEGALDAHIDQGLQEDVVAPVLVDEGGSRLAGGEHVVDGG